MTRSETNLEVYLPKDEDDRDVCMLQQLPKELARYFEVTDEKGIKVIGDTLQPKVALLDRLLKEAGVITLSNVTPIEVQELSLLWNEQSQTSAETPTPETSRANTPPHIQSTHLLTPDPTPSRTERAHSAPRAHELRPPPFLNGNDPRSDNARASSAPPIADTDLPPPVVQAPPPARDGYKRLLRKVIEAANQTVFSDNLEDWSVTNADTIFGAEGAIEDNMFGIRVENKTAHDIRIGAVGELFVRPTFSAFQSILTPLVIGV